MTNTSGCGTNETFSYNSYQPDTNVSINLQECVVITHRLEVDDECAPSYTVVTTKVR